MSNNVYTMICRHQQTGRTFSFNFDADVQSKDKVIETVTILINSLGTEGTDDELAALDLQIQMLLEQKRILTGKRGCGCGCSGDKK